MHRKAFDGEFLDDAGDPFAELHGTLGIDLVAHGDDRGQAVVPGVVVFAVGSSYSKISNNCFFLQLAVGKHLFRW